MDFGRNAHLYTSGMYRATQVLYSLIQLFINKGTAESSINISELSQDNMTNVPVNVIT